MTSKCLAGLRMTTWWLSRTGMTAHWRSMMMHWMLLQQHHRRLQVQLTGRQRM